ncbi:DUF7210 family protein [Comamonas aquatica]|uniref:DUF7210 family protein n=1 Tax=Comamonas aquatica TaxID=225991 RepID=UPI00244A5F40|nr:hypothetical protein [Comamonas aquatica]MDH0494248.1 hypothetical protein [Comamonas aquatica]
MSITKAKSAQAVQAADTVKVTLAKAHTHAGVDHPAGAELEVDQATATWLQEHAVTAPAATAVKA